MIDLTVMQQPSKPNRMDSAKTADTDKSRDKDHIARFDDAYKKQADQQVEPTAAEDPPVQDDQPEITDAAFEDDDAPKRASDEKKPSAETVLQDPDVAAIEAPVEKPKLTRALSENAFGEQVADARKQQLKPIVQQEEQPTRTVPATAFDEGYIDPATPLAVRASQADVKVQTAAQTPEAAVVSAPNDAASVFGKSKTVPDPVAQVEQAKPVLANSPSVAQAASLAAERTDASQKTPHPLMSADDGMTRSDERRARFVAQRNDSLQADAATRSSPNPLMAPKPAPVAPQPIAQVAATEMFDLSPVSAEPDAPVSFDTKTSAPPTLQQVLNRPETPAMVSRQLAEALQRFPDRPVEVALNPEELGRVRMTISAVETGITVTVLAERPETLDMMRRHIDQLAREFQAIGYDSINFAFSEGQSDQNPDPDPDQQGNHSTSTQADRDTPDDAINPIHLTATSGLDVRL